MSATLERYMREIWSDHVVTQGCREDVWRVRWEGGMGKANTQNKRKGQCISPSMWEEAGWTQWAARGEKAQDRELLGIERFIVSMERWPMARPYNSLKPMLGSFPPQSSSNRKALIHFNLNCVLSWWINFLVYNLLSLTIFWQYRTADL